MNMSKMVDVLHYDNPSDLYRAALAAVVNIIGVSLSEKGGCSIALSGGRTPRKLFELLAGEKNIAWKNINLFWVDERCLPQDHPDNNFKIAHDALLSKISIPQQNVHRIVTEGFTPSEASNAYEAELRKFFGSGLPQFELILLGMGDDGHTASLFPGDDALRETKRWVVFVDGKRGLPPVPRVTLTLPIINNSKCVLFLVSGEKKKNVMDEIMSDPESAVKKYPAAMVKPKGKLIWNIL